MKWIGIGWLGGILATGLLLVMPWLPEPMEEVSNWATFLGHFHPLIVHFPIGLISLVAIFEIIGRQKQLGFLQKSVPILLGLGLLSTLLSVWMGYYLYQSGEYGGELVRNHLWGGVVLGVGIILTVGLFRWKGRFWGYYMALVLTNIALIYTGHLGGSLTHGESYLVDAMPVKDIKAPIEAKTPEEYVVFEELVMPVLKRRCQSCHNPNKIKGGVLLTSYEDILKGGKSEKPGITPGDLEGSEVFQRVILDESEDGRMPPEGKPGLGEAERALLEWWISTGAKEGESLGDHLQDSAVVNWVSDLMPEILPQHRKDHQNRLQAAEREKTVESYIRKWDLVLTVDEAEDSTLLAVSMRLPPPYVNDAFLGELPDYGDMFAKLSLPATEITDDGLFHLTSLTQLRELYLQKTCISGKGLVYLQELPNLEVLNLSYTNVDDAGALHLMQFPSLKRVYLFHTEVAENVVEALRSHMPEVEILMEEGPYF